MRSVGNPDRPVTAGQSKSSRTSQPAAQPSTVGLGVAALATRDTFEAGPPAEPFQLPPYGEWTTDGHGLKSDPITFYVHGDLSQIEQSLKDAGWSKADPEGLRSTVKYVGNVVAQESLNGLAFGGKVADGVEEGIAGLIGAQPPPILPDKAPRLPGIDQMACSPQTLHGQHFLAAYEKDNHPFGGRHHLRIFDTGQVNSAGKPVYAIATSQDIGLRPSLTDPATGFMTHRIAPDVRPERDLILKAFEKNEAVTVSPFSMDYQGSSDVGLKVPDSKGYEIRFRG